MNISSRMTEQNILLDMDLPDKASVLTFISDTLVRYGLVKRAEGIREGLQERENLMSTGIGEGLGIPHTTSPDLSEAVLLMIRLKSPIPYEALDERPVDVILGLIVPHGRTQLHLRLLARISRLCRIPGFLEMIRRAGSCDEILHEMKTLEQKLDIAD